MAILATVASGSGASPAVQPAAEVSVNLSVTVDGDRLSVAAENASLDQILNEIAARAGFTVARSGSRYAPPLITGHKSGRLEDVLAWLLSTQNYVLFYEVPADGGSPSDVRVSEILLMNPPVGGPMTAAAHPAARTRAGSMDSGLARAGMPGDSLAADRDVPQRTLAALVPPPDAGLTGGAADPNVDAVIGPASRLSAAGNRLPDAVVDVRNMNIVRTVDLGGDALEGSYVMAHKAAGPALQRTDAGTWIPWDGREETLINNNFATANGGVRFDVVKGDLSDEFYPMTFTIAYRTKSGLKFGSFQVMPDQQSSM